MNAIISEHRDHLIGLCTKGMDHLHQIAVDAPDLEDCIKGDLRMFSEYALYLAGDMPRQAED